MGNFDRDNFFKSVAGFSRIIFGRKKPITETELNETQLIQNNQMRRLIANMLGDGVNNSDAITYENSVLNIGDCFFSCSGFLIKNTGLSIALADGETAYLQVWEETVTYQDTLKEEGNEQSSVTVENTIYDPDLNMETTRRTVVKYNLATTVDGTKANLTVARITGGALEVLVNNIKSTNLYEMVGKAVLESKAYTDNKIADLINGAPTTLDTLKEIADAMADNESVVEALNSAIGTKANASHTHSASNVTSGTLGGKVQANATAMATLNSAQVRDIYVTSSEITEGASSSLSNGTIVFSKA